MDIQREALGEVQANGQRRQPTVSAISGKPWKPGDVIVSFPNSPYSVGVNADEWRRLTPQQRSVMRAEWKRSLPESTLTGEAAATVSQPTLQDIETELAGMDFAGLKKHAADLGVNIAGRRSAEDVRQAVLANYIQTTLGVPSAPPETTGEASEAGESGGSEGQQP